MTNLEDKHRTDSESQKENQPYAPSWVNHLTRWVDRRAGSIWMYYITLGVFLLSIKVIILWIEGGSPITNFGVVQPYMIAVTVYVLGLMHTLDNRVGLALGTMRPALEITDEEYQAVRFRLTTMPAGLTLLASLAALAFVVLTEAATVPYRFETPADFPVSAALSRILYLLSWSIFGAYLYHSYHQLRVINHIYSEHTRIDLFRVMPLYAFSNLAALTSGSLAIISYGWLFVNPGTDWTDPVVLIPMLLLSVFAVATFVWPQIGIHQLQVKEKERLLDEALLRFKTTTALLHGQIDEQEFEDTMALNMAMSSLMIELKTLRKTPTWPWEPEVVQLLISALALPLGLWLIQMILQRTLSP